MYRFTLVLGLAAAASISWGCGTPGPVGKQGDATKRVTRPESKPTDKVTIRIIEALASPIPGPVLLGGDGKPDENLTLGVVPKDYPMDVASGSITEQVWAAREVLVRYDIDELPNLIEHLIGHLHDKRYSFTSPPAGPHCLKMSVGDACRDIIWKRVSPDIVWYINRYGADGKLHMRPRYFDALRQPGALEEWWRERRGRTLVQLQIEALEWTIKQERKIGFSSEAQKQRYLNPLLERLKKLRSEDRKQ